MDPLKANTLDRLRSLEHEIADLKRSLAQLQAEKPNPTNFLQVRPIHVKPHSGNSVSVKLVDKTGSIPRHRTRTRIVNTDANGRDYYFRAMLADMGMFDAGGGAVMIPPHHPFEAFQLFPPGPYSATYARPIIISRFGGQTQLANLSTSANSSRLTATDPGTYLCILSAHVVVQRQAVPTNIITEANVNVAVSSLSYPAAITLDTYAKEYLPRYSVPSSVSSNPGQAVQTVSFTRVIIWRPTSGHQLELELLTSNAEPQVSSQMSLIVFELGRNRALTGLNYTGTTTFGFTPSNFEFYGVNYMATATSVESEIGPVSPPPE